MMGTIRIFSTLGEKLEASLDGETGFKELLENVRIHNGWFTEENTRLAVSSIAGMLKHDKLNAWLKRYGNAIPVKEQKTIALVMAGNIPLVGFHDLLCVLITGHKALIKMSSDDNLLLPFVCSLLFETDPSMRERIRFTEDRLSDFDAVVATGSNNSSRYFEFYFAKYPHIIRKNRTSVAVLSGNESAEELALLGNDIFSYFGLGCRNVSKLYVPAGYDFRLFFEAMYSYREVVNNKKYGNNYDYQRAILLMSKVPLLDNNFMLLKEDVSLHSPVSVLNYEYYHDSAWLATRIEKKQEFLQCIVSGHFMKDKAVPFGKTQSPELWDYADGIDTIEFLCSV